ncbi:monosaccharide ABC transporter membrane protein (CUT2 family) [Leucobacter komagatae]|uniref:Autoinducer 2 import system permease protein LsrD n=1 Tax=Leucobacter komagatae TaxID=55969 RepID=A0A542Y7D2_9MICO|nr:ABC transporter permease [Leucobacter komagatae]TQL43981.1 monosaccharide ABC transporter membrane protein (CUT2 family) [Leucobacter komagatae]
MTQAANTTVTQTRERKRFSVREIAIEYAVLILLGAVIVALAILSPSFFTFGNIVNILNQNAPLVIIASAGTFVIVSGNFDLSTGAIYGVAGVVSAWLAVSTGNVVLALAAAPVVGVVLGSFNGIVITKLRVHSFLATLASSMIFTTIAVLITGGSLITVTTPGFTALGRDRIGGVFIAVFVMIIIAAAFWLLLSRTVFGRHVYAVGGNDEAAELSGINVTRTRVFVFMLSGLAAGTAAAIGVSRIASGQPLSGAGLELSAIAAVILGGTSIYGGVGAVWRSIAGVFLIALIGNGFDLLDLNPQLKDMVTGFIILAAVGLAAAGRNRR